MTGLVFLLESSAEDAVLEEINMLDRNDINFLDRGVVDNNSATSQKVSDIVLYSSATLPFITYFSKKCRSNGGAIALMVIETALINNGITNSLKAVTARYRPFNYNPLIDIETKLTRSSRRSFVSGHTSNTAAFAFLAARVITDLHPDMKNKFLVWASAASISAAIGVLRVQGGRHFPTDVIGGYVVGAAVGYLIPSLHLVKDKNINISTAGVSGVNVSLVF